MRNLGRTLKRNRLLCGVLGMLLLGVLSACGAGPTGRIALATTEADFGTIPNTDSVTHVFGISNTGDAALDVTGLSTSCSCTTATVSPEHLEPGGVAELTVTFDPTVHGGATGRFMRQVFIESNDPETPEAVFTFRIAVVEP